MLIIAANNNKKQIKLQLKRLAKSLLYGNELDKVKLNQVWHCYNIYCALMYSRNINIYVIYIKYAY